MRSFNIVLLILSALTLNVEYAVCLPVAEVKNARGTNLIGKGRVEEAQKLFQEAVDLDPNNVGYLANLGMAQKQLNLIEDAIFSFSRAKAIDPSFGNVESTLDELENIYENEELMEMLTKGDSDSDADIDELIDSLTKDAMNMVELGDLSGALVYFKHAYKKNVLNGNTLLNVAVTQMRLGEFEEARKSFQKCKTLLPEGDEGLAANLAALEEHENFERSNDVNNFLGEKDLDPKTAAQIQSLTKSAIRKAEAGEIDEAYEIFVMAAELNPTSRKGWENVGVTEMRMGMLDEAALSFNKAKALKWLPGTEDSLQSNMDALAEEIKLAQNGTRDDGDNAVIQAEVDMLTKDAIALAEQGMLPEALILFEKVVEKQPKNSDAVLNVGVTQMRVGLLDAAKKSFQQVHAMGGVSKEILKNNMEALKDHVKFAKSINHDHNEFYDEYKSEGGNIDGGGGEEDNDRSKTTNAAIKMAEGGDLAGSLSLFAAAVKEDPTNSKFHENLAVTQMRLGLIKAARKSLQKAKELVGPKPTQSIKDNLNALKEHEEYAKSIGHDETVMYKEYQKKGSDEEVEEEADLEINSDIEDAIALAEAGDLLGALELFEEVADGDSTNFMSWVNVAVTQMRLGYLNKARTNLNKAKSLKGGKTASAVLENFNALKEHVAYAKSIDHDFDELYEEYKEQGESSTEDDEDEISDQKADVDRAIKLAEAGEVLSALEIFESVAKKSPNTGNLVNLGITQMRLGLLNAAKKSLTDAKKVSGSGERSSIKSNFDALEEHIKFAKSKNHDFDTLYEEWREKDDGDDDYNDDDASDDVSDTGSVTDEAIALAEAGDVIGALELFEEAVEEDPKNPKSHENLGVTQMRLGLLNSAKKSFANVKKLLGNQPPGSLNDNLAALKEHFEYAKSIGHNPNKVYTEHGSDYGELEEDDDEYKEDDEDEDEEDLEHDESITDEAIALAEAGDMMGAVKLFKIATQRDPTNPKFMENLGVTQMRMGLLNAAKATFKKSEMLIREGDDLGSLGENMAALKQHVAYAKSINHDFNTVYAEYKNDQTEEYDDENVDGDDEYDEDEEEEEEIDADDVGSLTDEAIALAEAGDTLGALELFEQALDANPKDGEMHLNVGVTQMRLGLLNSAKASFKKCKALSGKRPNSPLNDNLISLKEHFEYAKSIGHNPNKLYPEYADASDNDDEEGDDEYDEGDEDEDEDMEDDEAASSLTDEAIALAEAGDVVGALELFEQAVKADPVDSQLYQNLGVTQMRLGLLNHAKATFKKCKKMQSALKMPLGNLNDNIAALKEHIEFAKSINHDFNKVYPEYEDMGYGDDDEEGDDEYDEYDEGDEDEYEDDEEEEGFDEEEVDTITDEAIALAEAGDVLQALEMFKKAVSANPTAPGLHENLGVTQMRLGLLTQAKKTFKTAKKLLGNQPPGTINDNLAALKEHVEFAKSINHDFNTLYPEYADQEGADEYGEGDEDEYDENDEDEDDEDEDDDDDEPGSLTDEAIALAESGDVVGALDLFKQAVKEDPTNPNAHENLGVTQMRLGLLNAAKASFANVKKNLNGMRSDNIDKNIEALEEHFRYAESIDHNPDKMYAEHYSHGVEDDYDDEYDPYEEEEEEEEDDEFGDDEGGVATSADPQLADRLTYKAIALAQQGDIEEAYHLFEEAVEASPREGQMWENLGITQIRMQMLEEAKESFIKARKLDKLLSDDHLESIENLLASQQKYGSNSIVMNDGNRGAKKDGKKRKSKSRQTVAEIGRFSDESDNEDSEGDDSEEGDATQDTFSSLTGSFGTKKRKLDNEIEIFVDLSQPLGVGLTRGARIDHLKEGGQFETAGAAAGDRIVAVESAMVYTLDHFKKALSTLKERGDASVKITVKQNGRPSLQEGSEEGDEEEEEEEENDYDSPAARRLRQIQRKQEIFRAKKNGGALNGDKANVGSGGDAKAILKAAMDLVMNQKFDDAVPLFERVVELNPQQVESYVNLGNIQRDTGRLEEAMIAYKHAMDIDPTYELLLTNMAELKQVAGGAFESLEVEVNENGEAYEAHHSSVKGDCGGQLVSIGDRVEVRDGDGEWGEGVVDSIEGGKAQVTKDDWDMSYEWEECKFLSHGSQGGDNDDAVNEVDEEVMWQLSDGTEPHLPGALFLEPAHLSKITKFRVKHDPENVAECGSEDFVVVYDKFGDIVFIAVDNFFTGPVIEQLRSDAIGENKKANIEWKWSHVHPDRNDPKVFRKGNGFPGKRSQNLPDSVSEMVKTCLKPILARVDDFDLNDVKEHQSLFGLVNMRHGTGAGEDGWLDSQRLPHNDVRWDFGTLPNGDVPRSYASVLPLTHDFENSGTGLWYEKTTGWSLLKNVEMNNKAQGRMNPHVESHLHPEVDLYQEIPDPAIHALTEHVWAKCFAVAQLRFNRFVVYDGRRLHQQYVDKEDVKRLSTEPTEGRLTMNTFLWQGP